MKFPNYPNVKDSGSEYLGVIPAHWDIMPVKFVLASPITDGPHETPQLFDEGIPFISAESVKNDRLDFSKKRGFISQEDNERFSRKYTPKRGDIYIVKSGATTGNVARVDTDECFNIWSPLAALRPDSEKATTDYLFYYIKSKPFSVAIELGWNYGTQQNIGMGVLANLDISVPPLEEQQKIAAFLDRKTAEIDTLIAKKRRLLDRLAEKRTALITRAVTKGLNPDAPMKDSGIEWLGEIPAHWEVRRLKQLIAEPFKNGIFKKKEHWGAGTPIINVGDLYPGNEVNADGLDRLECSEEEKQKYDSSIGDFFFVRSSLKLDGIGKSASLLQKNEPTVFECHVVRGRPITELVEPRFLSFVLNSTYARAWFVAAANAVTMATIDQSKVKDLVIGLPGYSEQQRIADFVELNMRRLDHVSDRVLSVIGALQEYRSALITNAVTGQIKVA